MGQIAASNRQVNAVIPLSLVGIIDERADALSLTRGKFAALIFAWWEREGCPAVTPADAALLKLTGLKVAEVRSKYGKK